jgi:hypothetical protein
MSAMVASELANLEHGQRADHAARDANLHVSPVTRDQAAELLQVSPRMKPQNTAFALALISECSKNGTCPPVELLWWLVDACAAAVQNGTSVDVELGINGKSINRSARLRLRNACLLQARGMIGGSDRAASLEIAARVERLEGFAPDLRKRRIRDEADGLVLTAMQHGATANPEGIRAILRGSKSPLESPTQHR